MTRAQELGTARTQAGGARPDAAVSVVNVELGFGDRRVLSGVSLDIPRGQIVVLIGPSGCGKSTLLNAIAGIVKPQSGTIECMGSRVTGLNRRVAYLTQRDTLLPWRDALHNAALPLEIKGVSRPERLARAHASLERLGIADSAHLRPHQLSGGMRSRLALARMLLTEADVVLMDEPFAAIDALMKVKLQQLVVDVWTDTKPAMVYVTHDLNEAIALGHEVVVIGRGKIRARRSVEYAQPRDLSAFRTSRLAEDLNRELWSLLQRESQDDIDTN